MGDKHRTVVYRKTNKNKTIPSKKKDSYYDKKFLTMDIETRVVNTKMMPYCISIFNGTTTSAFYLTDFINEEELIRTSITKLFIAENDKQNVYVHNFSYFDGILLLGYITDMADDVKIIMRENSIINVKAIYETVDDTGKTMKRFINFRDSYNLLPAELSKLAKSFGVTNKSIFPYAFINENNDINYVGPIPDYKYFEKTKVSLEEYNLYADFFKDKPYDIMEETIKYCNQDVITLYEVINSFSFYIFEKFSINMHNSPTVSSLAFAIFRSNFLNTKLVQIPVILGDMYKELKLSYYGGAVDVYKPYGENIKEYDVNSLYPYVMKEFDMPVGQPIYFEGELDKVKEFYLEDELSKMNIINKNKPNIIKPFGFFYCEVISPEEMFAPIIPIKKIDFKSGQNSLTPTGKWTGWYFSEEIENAKKYGYQFKIHKGYLFNRQNIFKDYVELLYSIKKEFSQDTKHPLYIIVKLLLNS